MGRAFDLFRRAAEQGFAPAQNNLAYFYERGLKVPVNVERALAWYRRAAEQGFAPAENNLGVLLAFGVGLDHDDASAVAWFRRAAEAGDAEAAVNLAFMLANGKGVVRDFVEAFAWLTLAAEAPGPAQARAHDYQVRLAGRLDAAGRSEATRKAAALAAAIARADNGPPPPEPRDSADLGDLAVAVQRRLATLGLYQGVVDGIAGVGTAAAIRAFVRRTDRSLPTTVYARLLAALDAAVAARRAGP